MFPPSGKCDLSRFWLSPLCLLVFLLPRLFKYLALSVPDEGYSRNEPCALSLISAFLLSLDKTSSGGGSLTDRFHCYNLSSLVHIAFLWLQSNNTCYGSSRLVKALINFILYSKKNVTILF